MRDSRSKRRLPSPSWSRPGPRSPSPRRASTWPARTVCGVRPRRVGSFGTHGSSRSSRGPARSRNSSWGVPSSKRPRRKGLSTHLPATAVARRSTGTRTPKPSPIPSNRSVPLTELPLDDALRHVLERDGITALFPPQAAALGPVLAGESVVLACPTASGKSLVAYLALLRATRTHRTGLYLVPLRALAQEKAEELGRFEELGLKVGLSTGDFDLSNDQLDRLDVLVATSEKADSLLRRGSPWLDRLGVVVIDEVHLLRDPERGPTLEVSITRLRRSYPNLQLVALSATVGNSPAVAKWLQARHIASDFRPV